MTVDGEACERAGRLLAEAERVVVLTGAGISTESGIPDFRSPGGLWDRYDPTQLTYDRFVASEETRRLYWELSTEAYPVLRDAEPNAAHHAVTAIERAGKLTRLVTQNVDGLHAKAGTSAGCTTEIHGSSMRAKCIDCDREHDREALHRRLVSKETLAPRCEGCGGPVKPATVSFGQAMPERETALAFAAAAACDLMIVAGSSLVVYPAASLPDEAHRGGARVVIVNNEATPKDALASVVVRGGAGPSMARMLAAAGLAVEAVG